MKHLIFGLGLAASSSAVSASDADKTPQFFFRCESQGMDFSEGSWMKSLGEGKYSLVLKEISASNLKDNCVFTLLEGDHGEMIDLVPMLPLSEAAIPGHVYPAGSSPSHESFEVNFQSPGFYSVYFDRNSRSFLIVDRIHAVDL